MIIVFLITIINIMLIIILTKDLIIIVFLIIFAESLFQHSFHK